MKAKLGLFVILAVLFTMLSSSGFSKEPEEIWEELSKLNGEKRQNFLYSKAKAEGEVVWYTTKNVSEFSPLRNDFKRRFPGVKIEVWRASGERVVNRVMTEARVGRLDADVMNISNEFLPTLIKARIVGRYRSPQRMFFYDSFKDKEGYWTSHTYTLAIIAYNTSLVSSSEAPKRYEDFHNLKWKGNFAIDTDADRAMMGWLKIWGSEKTEKFLDGIIKNDVAVRRGHTLMTQLLCAGEFKAAIELYAFRVAELKHKGCPVEMVFPDPTPGAGSPLTVAKHSPHPYGAALLTDYLLSETGQKILADGGRLVGRRGIRPKYQEMDVKKRGIQLLLLRPEDAEKFGEKYLQLRERFLLIRR